VAGDGAARILTVPEDAELALRGPSGHELDHFQSQLRARAILPGSGLSGLFAFPFSVAAPGQAGLFAFAIEGDEEGERPSFLWSKIQRFQEARRNSQSSQARPPPRRKGDVLLQLRKGPQEEGQ
jgi:hypothetical protein